MTDERTNERARALLLTGAPGVGKTTLLVRLAERLRDRPVRGFVTEEVREGGRRRGFAIRALDTGRVDTLADVDVRSPHRVGRYGVDVDALDRMVGETLVEPPDGAVVLVDEIGKMECFSTRFVEAVRALLDAGHPLVATVATKGRGFIAEVKERSDVARIEVTRDSRDVLLDELVQRLGGAASGG